MNYRMIFYILGHILKVEGALMLLPAFTSVIFKESSVFSFFVTIALLLAVGFALSWKKPRDQVFFAKEGFVVVALAWILLSAFGALPFYISGAIPSYVDALFEMISGFTTTGASILSNVEALPNGMLFWRSFSHWIGGMGVLVFVLAIVPLSNERSMHLMRAEVPGPEVGKLAPKARSTAMILYGIYVGLTVIEIVLLLAGGMPMFDSLCHAFGTAGTGGFSIKAASIAYYNSAYIDWVITIFMILFGMNFNLFYLILIGRARQALKSEELRCYLGIIIVSIAIITVNTLSFYPHIWESIRHAAFQVGSIITTTGYATVDFNLWPELSRMILVMLMFFGACGGSTGGGIKTSRLIILVKTMGREIKRMVHPRSVQLIKLDGKVVEEETITGVNIFFTAYIAIIGIATLLVSINGFDFTSNFTAVLACISNIGPGLEIVGPMGNYAAFSAFSKLVLSFVMLVGRLEVFPMILLLSPSIWRRK